MYYVLCIYIYVIYKHVYKQKNAHQIKKKYFAVTISF